MMSPRDYAMQPNWYSLLSFFSVLLVGEINGQYQQPYRQQPYYAHAQPQTRQLDNKVVARGSNTNQNAQPLVAPSGGLVATPTTRADTSCSSGEAAETCSLTGGYDFNPALLGGQRGAAGIKARINSRGFQYFSTLIAPILTNEIRRARIPNINQCIPQVNGCIQVYNIYVSRFRCPQRVILYPASPNQVVLAVENLDIGVTGNLGGQINIILPIALYGIVQMNAHQLSLRVALVIDRASTGGLAIRVASCHVTVGYVDVYIENGGLIGDIANSQFRGRISEMVRSQLPTQLCGQVPNIVNQQLSGKLTSIPQSIQLSQMLQLALNSFGISNLLNGGGGGQCPSACARRKLAAAPRAPNGVLQSPQQSALLSSLHAQNVSQLTLIRMPQQQQQHVFKTNKQERESNPPKVQLLGNGNILRRQTPTRHVMSHTQRLNRTNLSKDSIDSSVQFAAFRSRRKRRQASARVALVAPPVARVKAAGVAVGHVAPYSTGVGPIAGPVAGKHAQAPLLPPPPPVPGAPISLSNGGSGATKGQLAFATPGTSPCNCPSAGGGDSPLAILSVILTSLDFNKLSNIYLTVQFLQGYATSNDYTVELNGEFSPGGLGGTPFGAFPMQFPSFVGHKMAEILISDWTINSLFYHLHRVGFISIRIGPETPKIGDLLKTTCSTDELEDHGVETDGGDSTRRRRRRDALDAASSNATASDDALARLASGVRRRRHDDSRIRRQDAGGGLSDLGICLGDILPSVKEKHPNQKIVIHIHTARAPSVILSARNGGTATLNFVFDVDLHIQATNEKVGTIQVAATLDFTVKTTGGRISAHADITNLQLRDTTNSLGLPQDGLDNLGNLGKELLLKAGNDALEKGAPLNLPPNIGGLPLTFVSPEVGIVEHALHLAADFTIDPSALSQLGLGGGGSC